MVTNPIADSSLDGDDVSFEFVFTDGLQLRFQSAPQSSEAALETALSLTLSGSLPAESLSFTGVRLFDTNRQTVASLLDGSSGYSIQGGLAGQDIFDLDGIVFAGVGFDATLPSSSAAVLATGDFSLSITGPVGSAPSFVVVPEPTSFAMVSLVGMALLARRRHTVQKPVTNPACVNETPTKEFRP